MTSGIPQGLVLGPLLFVLNINDLPDLTKSNTVLFSDDFKILRPMMNRDDYSILQQDITLIAIIEQWSGNWRLKLYPDKFRHMEI